MSGVADDTESIQATTTKHDSFEQTAFDAHTKERDAILNAITQVAFGMWHVL